MVALRDWNGVIRMGEFRLPVQLYSAAVDRTVHFHLLHDADRVRVQQRMVDSQTGDVWSYQDAKRGYEVEQGLFVMISDEDLTHAEPAPSRDIDILCLVDAGAIDPPWYDRPYYLAPPAAERKKLRYRPALEQERLEGIARWVFRRKEYVGVLCFYATR